MSPIDRMRKRYDEDAPLAAFVDCARSVFRDLQLTPTEMREAVVFACFLEEMRRPWPVRIDMTPDIPRHEEVLQAAVNELHGYRTNARSTTEPPKRERILVFRDERTNVPNRVIPYAAAIWEKTSGIDALLFIEEYDACRLRIRLLSSMPLSDNTVQAARAAAKSVHTAGVDLRVSQYEM